MESKPATSSNQSTEKAFKILEFLAAQPEPLKLLDIARELNMNASTALRFITSMEGMGYIEHDEDKYTYAASTKICELSNSIISRFQLTPIAHSYIEKISKYTNETTCLTVERKSKILYVDIALNSNRTLMNIQKVGNSAPLYCTASGKLFLSQYTSDELDSYIETRGLPRLTSHTLTTRAALESELEKIRSQGYSIDDEENEVGVRCIAFPIYGKGGKVIACASITGPAMRVTMEYLESIRPFLQSSAAELSARMQSAERFYN